MKSTRLFKARRYLIKVVIILFCIMLLAFKLTRDSLKDYNGVLSQLSDAKILLLNVTGQLQKATIELNLQKTKVAKLIEKGKKDKEEISWQANKINKQKSKMFVLELAKNIELRQAMDNPAKRLGNTNEHIIEEYITSAMKFEELYKKKYPEYKACYSWKTMIKLLKVECDYDMDPPQGPDSELGGPQIEEYDVDKKTKRKTNTLYNMLCHLGYKKANYYQTILAYRRNPKIQMDCMYQWFTFKLNDKKGAFSAALVAYNSSRTYPEQSIYWIKYQSMQKPFQRWCDEAQAECN